LLEGKRKRTEGEEGENSLKTSKEKKKEEEGLLLTSFAKGK